MSDSFIQVPPDSTGKQVATNEANGKQYQIVNIADSDGVGVNPPSEDTLATVLYFLAKISDNLPRTDSADRQAVNVETGNIGTVTTVTTVSTVTSCTTVGTVNTVTAIGNMSSFGGVQAPFMTLNQSVPHHIYNNIDVT